MTQDSTSEPRKPNARSAAVTAGPNRAAARSYLRAAGMQDADFDKPMIGIVNTWSTVTPCNMHIDKLAIEAEKGANAAGAKGVIFNTITISDGISMGTAGMKASLISREVVADSIELAIEGHQLDGVVCIVGCDKTTPSLLMGAASCDIPTIMVSGGPMLNGYFRGERVGSGTHLWKFSEAVKAGTMTKEEFVKEVLTGLTPPPAYFPQNVMMNIQGYDSIDEVLERGVRPLTPAEFEAAANETGAMILDTRDAQVFAKGFVPNSINIGIDGSFAVWVGAMIPDLKQEILVVAEEGREEEVITRLARVGYDYSIGYLGGGFKAWKESGHEVDSITSISVDELAKIKEGDPQIHILDVRKNSEYLSEHVLDAENAPLDYINDSMIKVDKNKTYYVHCAGGYRSMVFNSILRARGYDNLIDVAGGFKAIKESEKFKVTDYVCPTTLL